MILFNAWISLRGGYTHIYIGSRRRHIIPLLIQRYLTLSCPTDYIRHIQATKTTKTKTITITKKKTNMPDTYGWIWPKDPRPGNPTHWPRHWRLLDVLRNRGPDIFVGRIQSDTRAKEARADLDGGREAKAKAKKEKGGRFAFETPTATGRESTGTQSTCWSRWEYDDADEDVSHIHPALRTRSKTSKKRTEPKSPFPWARRHGAERYDFRTKRYCIPDIGTWSRVQYCNVVGGGGLWRKKHSVPMRSWDRNGNEYPAGYWHDVIHGADSGCDRAGVCYPSVGGRLQMHPEWKGSKVKAA